MIAYPNINPVAFHIGTWPVYWYGLMYLIGFTGGWGLLIWRHRVQGNDHFTEQQIGDTVFYTALGAVLGGRVGYMLFYDWRAFFHDPVLLFKPWLGGMAFHGGLLGVMLAMGLLARHYKKPFLALTDLIAPVVPVGLAAGRIGNFINGELWGRVTNVPWAMIFPKADNFPRHPSQLYEVSLEGVLLFAILWTFAWKPRPLGAVSGLFALCYGIFRCIAECFREPDAPIGYLAFGWLTEGQLLSIPLMALGIYWLYKAYSKEKAPI